MVAFNVKIPGVSPGMYTSNRTPGTPREKTRTAVADFRAELFQFTTETQSMAGKDLDRQNALFSFDRLSAEEKAGLVYQGRSISELSAREASDLIKEDGFFGVTKTAGRISDFVLAGAGNDLDRLKAGRDGILKGFKEAETAWGGKLPEISYKTLEKSLETIDEQIKSIGGSLVDLTT